MHIQPSAENVELLQIMKSTQAQELKEKEYFGRHAFGTSKGIICFMFNIHIYPFLHYYDLLLEKYYTIIRVIHGYA